MGIFSNWIKKQNNKNAVNEIVEIHNRLKTLQKQLPQIINDARNRNDRVEEGMWNGVEEKIDEFLYPIENYLTYMQAHGPEAEMPDNVKTRQEKGLPTKSMYGKWK